MFLRPLITVHGGNDGFIDARQHCCLCPGFHLNGTVRQLLSSLIFGLAEIELQYQKKRQAAGIPLAKGYA